MKYNVDKKKFRALLVNQPRQIKKVSLDEGTAAYLVEGAPSCYEYIQDDELRASVKVVRAYIKELMKKIETTAYSGGPRRNLRLIPRRALGELTLTERKFLIKFQYEITDMLPDKVYAEWLCAVEQGYPIRDVPEKYWKRTTLYQAYGKYIKNCGGRIVHDKMPDVYWERDPEENRIRSGPIGEELVDIIRKSPYFIEVIPPTRVTKAMLIAAFQSGKEIDLTEEYKRIPFSSWDRGVVALALNCNMKNIDITPPSLLTEDDAISAAEKGIGFDYIPVQILTRKVKVHVAAHRYSEYSAHNPAYADDFPELRDVAFQCDVVSLENEIHGPKRGVKNIQDFVKPEDREAVLEANPYFIEYIPKLEQTDDIINILLSKATPGVLDVVAEFINLGKIKKFHAPLLVGCTNNLILSTIEKKLKGPPQRNSVEHAETVQNSSTIEITATPVDYSKIRDKLDSYEE